MECIIANKNEDIKLTRFGFMKMCIAKRTVAIEGWTPKFVGKLPPEYQLEICRSCKIGQSVEDDKEFLFPDFIEEIHISDFKQTRNVKMTKKKTAEHPSKEPIVKDSLDEIQKVKLLPKKKPQQRIEELQLALGKVIFNPQRYPTLSHWAKALNNLSHSATLVAIESDIINRQS